jgi:hypothetical protein
MKRRIFLHKRMLPKVDLEAIDIRLARRNSEDSEIEGWLLTSSLSAPNKSGATAPLFLCNADLVQAALVPISL